MKVKKLRYELHPLDVTVDIQFDGRFFQDSIKIIEHLKDPTLVKDMDNTSERIGVAIRLYVEDIIQTSFELTDEDPEFIQDQAQLYGRKLPRPEGLLVTNINTSSPSAQEILGTSEFKFSIREVK
ncbi:MAG: hypothetical protein EP346_06900 [Bacteroidetes bacterium]|nr:MAG: hypothetical protein EP346_06900 [Bacteroidota bacterium]